MEIEKVRHSLAHVMAQAVVKMYPGTKVAIGPAIEHGFYYDFEFPEGVSFSTDNLPKLIKEMKKIIQEKQEIVEEKMSIADAKNFFKDEKFKLELIEGLEADGEKEVTIYKNMKGDEVRFADLCRGPHVSNTSELPADAFVLNKVAGAYWRGDENREMLTRIYGLAFATKEELEVYLVRLEEAIKRDHNKLGRELEIFTSSELVGQGLPLIMPKGAKIMQTLIRYVEDEEESRGYKFTRTPIMSKSDLFKVSGHWDHYKDGMFVLGDEEKDEEVYALRPMTCPFQYLIYKAKPRSYRDLPLRYSETSPLFRNEASGEMHGLIRLRQFHLADAHIMCAPEQVEEEFKDVIILIQDIMKAIGIDKDVTYRFSKWDGGKSDKYIDNPEAWESTQILMKEILDHIGLDYVEADNEAAFYGPKLDVQFVNVHGKEDTLFTVQIDFALAERFDMTYIDKDNEKKRPFIIHRSSIGCYERTLAMLIEKYAGAFPFWIAPEQVRVISVGEAHIDMVKNIVKELKAVKILSDADVSDETVGKKIKRAASEKIPYTLVIGDKEMEDLSQVSVKIFGEAENVEMGWDMFKKKLEEKNAEHGIGYDL